LKKSELFSKTLLTAERVAAYIPLTNEGGAPLATTSCALVKSQRDVHRKVISKAGSPVRISMCPDPTADNLSFGRLVL